MQGSFWDRFQMLLGEERSERGGQRRAEFYLGRRFYLFAERDGFENYGGINFGGNILGDDEAENPLVFARRRLCPWRFDGRCRRQTARRIFGRNQQNY